MLAAGYVQFQYVIIALEFIKNDLESNTEEFVHKEGRFWNVTLQAAVGVVKAFYVALR